MRSSKTIAVRALAGAALTGLTALSIAGCGNDVPANAVAKVGDSVITKKDFDRWLKNASASSQQQGAAAVQPDPPDFEKCIAEQQKQPVPKGQAKPSADALKKTCKERYDQIKQEVMQFLIQAEWVQQEAEKQDVEVTDAEVKKSFDDQKKQAFPKEADYQKFLEESGQSEEDILFRVKLDTLQTKLTQKITKDAGEVSDDEISEYYEKNKERFAQPERRDLNIVLTKTEAKANQARAQIEDGKNFKAVAKEFSIDEASKAQGGKLPAVAKGDGQQEKALNDAAFKAKKGQLQGPIKTQFGYYVFEVTKVTQASQQSLDEAEDDIKNVLRSQNEQKTLDKFIKDFREKYKDDTQCADDYTVAECGNAPKDKTDTGPAAGQVPGQPQPQTAPPAGAPQGAPQGTPPATPEGGAPTPAPTPTPPPSSP